MAKPFAVEPRLTQLPSPYPSVDELRGALSGCTRRSREIVVRLWLTEGLPFAFRECPAVYEEIRGWLSTQLDIHPKEVTLIGSARMGYSLAPTPEFGKPFGKHSDLDLSVVSEPLFERLVATFNLFAEDYKKQSVVPRNDRERALWDANLDFGRRNISRGFLDADKLPNFARYSGSQMVNQTMWVLIKKLEVTTGTPKVRRASARVYRNWPCFIDQASLNLRCALPTT